jgi:hypothetical protein
MAIKDLIPWNNRGREVSFQRDRHPSVFCVASRNESYV